MTTLFDVIKAKNPDFSDTDKIQLSKRLLLLFQLSVLQENVCKDIERELGGYGVYGFSIKHNHERIKRMIRSNYDDFFKRFSDSQTDEFCADADDLQKIVNEWAGINDRIL